MKNEQKIVELLSEMLQKFDILNEEVKGMNKRMGKVEREIVKLNVIGSENSRALIKLADNNDRIVRLEKAVFK
jgi:hypothetical protein